MEEAPCTPPLGIRSVTGREVGPEEGDRTRDGGARGSPGGALGVRGGCVLPGPGRTQEFRAEGSRPAQGREP